MFPGPRAMRKECHPVPVTCWGACSEAILSHVAKMDGGSESPWKFHQPPKITRPSTTFLDFHPGIIYFLGGKKMPLRNSRSRTKGKLSCLLEEDLPQGIMSHIGSRQLVKWFFWVCVDTVTLPESCMW